MVRKRENPAEEEIEIDKKKIERKSKKKKRSKVEEEEFVSISELFQEEKTKSKSSSSSSKITTAEQQQQRSLFVEHCNSIIKLSPLELSSFSDSSFMNLSENLPQDVSTLSEHIKASFGSSWEEKLCKKKLPDKESQPGSPVLLTITLSALRSLELLRGLRPFTKECPAAKLFSKHIKVEEQVSFLKTHHVNIACGTPSRIKKLIDMEALGLSRLDVIVLDMQTDVKGYSLFTLRQVRDEFWDLYKTYFHQQLLKGGLCICLYGGTTADTPMKEK